MPNPIGENIKILRQQKGISQDRLSKEADLALNTIVKIETDESPNPTAETLNKIAEALGISVGSLFVLPKKSLRELKKDGLIKLSNVFSGSGLENRETGLNRIFLKSVELTNDNKKLKLTAETKDKNEKCGYIRSENKEILEEIKNVLETMMDKSISEIYNEKIFIYEQ